MPGPITVWAVELRPNLGRERKGVLTLEPDALSFTPHDGSSDMRIVLVDVRKARRLRGSPVLMVDHRSDDRAERTAFYFAQPPPLQPVREEQPQRVMPLGFGRSSKRKARRQNVGYLSMWNRELKDDIQEWVEAIGRSSEAKRG